MPIPGPRTQTGPVDGYRNPHQEQPERINHWLRPGSILAPGRSPGTMVLTLRGCILAAGQIRMLWRQSINVIPAQAPYSWTESGPAPGRPVHSPEGLGITRALRYMARSVYVPAGIDNSRFAALHTHVGNVNHHKTITLNAGQVRNRPTVRNRTTSFGSRVPTLNQQAGSAESDN